MPNEPWHLVLFYGAGVFCFLALALIKYSEYATETSIKYRVVSENFAISFIGVDDAWTAADICFKNSFRNLSDYPMMVSIIDDVTVLQDKTNAGATKAAEEFLIPTKIVKGVFVAAHLQH
jgi:hypothetical protein